MPTSSTFNFHLIRFIRLHLSSLLITAVLAFLFLSSALGQRYALSLALLGIIFVLLTKSPGNALPVMLVFLAALGGLRRWLIPLLDYSANDPLLLIVPIALFLNLGMLFMQRRIVLDTPLSRMVCWLLVLMVAEIVNPLQGGPLVGIAGAFFYIVPLLWYFLGRQIGDVSQLRRLYRAAIGIAFVGALYGFKQTWFGLAASEEEWLRLTKFNQVLANGSVRTLSFFTNGGEYSLFVGFGIAMLWAAFLRGKRLALLPIPLLLLALFLASYRSSVVATLLACTVIWAVQGRTVRSWLPRGLVALAVAGAGLSWSLQQVAQVNLNADAQAALKHQVEGLLNTSDSTAGSHYSLFVGGISDSFKNPLGRGLGATTLAGSKFGDTGAGTEFDISNMFVVLGPVGGVLYTTILFVVFRTAFRHWMRVRSLVALGIIGVLVLFVGHWLEAGYAGYILVWFSIGALERMEHRHQIEQLHKEQFHKERLPRNDFIGTTS